MSRGRDSEVISDSLVLGCQAQWHVEIVSVPILSSFGLKTGIPVDARSPGYF